MRNFLFRLSAGGSLVIASVLAFGSFSDRDSTGRFLVWAAQAQSQFEEKVQELGKDAREKLKSLIEQWRHGDKIEGFAKTNGRIEATEIDVSSKYAGRLASVTVDEGDEVKAGQVIGRINSPEYEAQLRTAQANVLVAKSALASAEAQVTQRKADQVYAQRDLERGQELVKQGWMTKQVFDQRVDKADSAKASLEASEKQREAAKSMVLSTEAEVDRIASILADLTILSPRDGRVQYRLHRSGEVVNAGTRIVQILDLNDVYMTIYLPAADAGKLAVGDQARLILDPYPDLVIPARVSFVATEAQFTPKPVETATEREKLIFRVKLQVDPKVLRNYHAQVKTGIRGMGFVRTSPLFAWPDNLAVKLPEGPRVQSDQIPRPDSDADQGRQEAKENKIKQQAPAGERRHRSSRSHGRKHLQ
jgi:HlyD family secretion protein